MARTAGLRYRGPMTDFAATRRRFHLPEGVIYLDGNSLGPPPEGVEALLRRTVSEEWGDMLIGGWNRAGWMDLPARLGDRIGRLIGAAPGTVTLGDTLTVKLFQALAAAIDCAPEGRRTVLSDSGNFPSDLYAAESLLDRLGDGWRLVTVAPEAVAGAIDDDTAVLMLTEVDYRTGRLHDMAALTALARATGAATVWNLAHSAGALPVDLGGAGADFAVGCTYKYLNAGPGAPAFLYAAPERAEAARPLPAGWLGHAEPFAFEADYRPAPGAARFRVGTPPVLALRALEAALDIWDDVDMGALRARSIALSERLIAGVEAACPDLRLASPRDPAARGSQVSFAHPQGYAVMQALIARGVIGDFRAPDLMRFGLAPLYLSEADIDAAVVILADILATGAWDQPRFHARQAVT